MCVVDDDLRSFVGHVTLSFTLENKNVPRAEDLHRLANLLRQSGGLHGPLPEPIRADPTLGVILSQLTFVSNFETVMRDYTNRLYFGIDLGDTNGLAQPISTIACTCALSMTQKLAPTIGSS